MSSISSGTTTRRPHQQLCAVLISLRQSEIAARRQKYSLQHVFNVSITDSSGSVLFSRSKLLKRKDLPFSFLRLGLIRHRYKLKILTLFLKYLTRFSCHTLESARLHLGVRLMTSSLCVSLFLFVTFVTEVSLYSREPEPQI